MNIVIVGAGEVGRYISSILSKEQHNVILIDKEGKKLEQVSSNIDVATRQGLGTDWQLLEDLTELSPDLLIALTNDDETNIVACSIAKHLGYPKTIARVKDSRYLNRTRLDFAKIFDVDYFLCPELLVAHDVLKHILNPRSLMIENFANGAVQLMTIRIPSVWRNAHVPLKKLDLPQGVICGLIKRHAEGMEERLIFPHGDDCILSKDEVTLIGETDVVSNAMEFFGLKHKVIHSAVIGGGSLTGINLAQLLVQRKIDVRIIEKDFSKCTLLSQTLASCTVMHHDAADIDFLRSEKVGYSEVVVACTASDETNLMIGLLSKETGCEEAIVTLTNLSYVPIISKLGIDYTASPRVSASNHILSQVLTGTVSSLISLYDNRAEVMEVNVSYQSKLVGIPLSDLGPLLPKDFLIAMIQNRGRIMIGHGDRIISPGDTVIVITDPKHVPELKKIF